MDIFLWLRKDHVEALGALKTWVRRPGGSEGAEARARWNERWEVHVRIEEHFLFPLLKGEPDLRRLLEQSVDAHDRIRKRMQEMPAYERNSPAWSRAMGELLESLEGLLEMEERRLFPRAQSFLPGEDAEELAQEVMDFLSGLHSAFAAG